MDSPTVYIPIDRRHALASGKSLPERMSGSALFADISGFTPLTEALAEELGRRRGAEELTKYLNRVYNALISELHRYRGSVISFSGDAITCWLDGDDGRRAIACALNMQKTMGQFAEIQTLSGRIISLAMKAAVVTGSVRRFVVGNADHTLVDVMAGQTLDRLAQAEHLANKGDVIVDKATVDNISPGAAVSEWRMDEATDETYAAVTGLNINVPESPWPKIDEDALRETAGDWLLPAVHQRLSQGQGEFLAELRPASALFLRFSGIDYDQDDDAPEKLQAFIQMVEEILTRYEGSLLQLTLGDKGSYLYAGFGAPVAHEDDVPRALATALEIQKSALKLDFVEPLQIGITMGRMRTGAYGSDTRRTYGVLGDRVNLSARLMTAAQPGEILVNQDAYAAAGDGFLLESKPAINVKGKSEPIALWRLIDRKQKASTRLQEPQYSLPMVGRTEELALIAKKMDEALSGKGQIAGVAAEAGMGKSRLAAEVIRTASEKNFAGFAGECQSYGTNTVYLVWRDIWRDIFNLPADLSPEEIETHLINTVSLIDESLTRRVPLLGTLLNVSIPDNELTASLDAKIRKSSLESMLVTCLRAKALDGPVFLVLEDCHWLDPLSSDLIEAVGRSIVDLPVFMLLVYRQLGSEVSKAPNVAKLAHFSEIALMEFSQDEAATLIQLKLAQIFGEAEAVPPHLLEQVTEKAAGNPFYIEELLNLLRDRGIDPNDSQALMEIDLPTSLYSLILTRIDQLTERQNAALKVASVIGRLFQAAMVWGIYPELGGKENVLNYLEGLSTLDLTPLDAPEPEYLYLFKHIIIQEVAYESLLYSTRAMLHERIGSYIEQNNADHLDQFLNLLAHHYGRSENSNKKREFVLKAGYASQAVYDNEAAISFFKQALPLLSTSQKLEVNQELGKVLEILGRWDEAHELYQTSLELAQRNDSKHAMATFHGALAELARKQGHYEEAEEELSVARQSFEELQDRGGVAHMLAVEGIMSAEKGSFDKAKALWEESLEIRRELGESARVASMLGNLGIVARHQKNFELARSLQEEALAICRELDDPFNIARTLINLGNVSLDQGNREEARRRLEEALDLLREVGDRWMYGLALEDLGVVVRSMGDLETARQLFDEAILIFRDLDDRRMLAFMLEDFACLAALEDDSVRSLHLVGAASALREEIDVPLSSLEVDEMNAVIEPARGKLAEGDQENALEQGREFSLDKAIEYALSK